MFKINMHETFITCIKSRDKIRDKNVRVYIYIYINRVWEPLK